MEEKKKKIEDSKTVEENQPEVSWEEEDEDAWPLSDPGEVPIAGKK